MWASLQRARNALQNQGSDSAGKGKWFGSGLGVGVDVLRTVLEGANVDPMNMLRSQLAYSVELSFDGRPFAFGAKPTYVEPRLTTTKMTRCGPPLAA
jgi:hypothetical protein